MTPTSTVLQTPISIGAGVIASVGPAAFALLTWGAIALVLAGFGYIVWALLVDRSIRTERSNGR
ncbi:MAG: hypothetical protein ACQETB_08840 [Halobacteriota archaeon]